MCSKASRQTQNINFSYAPELLAEQKHLISHVLQGPFPTQENIDIYIIFNWITPNISNKSSCSYAVGSLTQFIKIKHQGNIIINGAHTHSVRPKIQDITIPWY